MPYKNPHVALCRSAEPSPASKAETKCQVELFGAAALSRPHVPKVIVNDL